MHLNLRAHTANPVIISSLAWNAIRDILEKQGKGGLMKYVESVKVTDKSITVKTGKPIVNAELTNHKEALKERINEAFKTFGVPAQERKMVFI